MITGQGATSSIWTPVLLQNLAQDREVIIFDNKGIGESTYDGDDYTVQSFAESTLDLVEALGLEKPDVLGWSLGGSIAMTYAGLYPSSIRRLVTTVSRVQTASGCQHGWSCHVHQIQSFMRDAQVKAQSPLQPYEAFWRPGPNERWLVGVCELACDTVTATSMPCRTHPQGALASEPMD